MTVVFNECTDCHERKLIAKVVASISHAKGADGGLYPVVRLEFDEA